MTTTSSPTPATLETVQLAPSYHVPIALVGLALVLFFVNPWVGGAIALLGVLLLYQTVSLRLQFTATDVDLYRGEQLIRRFPYREWQNWRIFWSPLPILLYFKEVNSIHFLPILFDPKMLKTCLEQRCPTL